MRGIYGDRNDHSPGESHDDSADKKGIEHAEYILYTTRYSSPYLRRVGEGERLSCLSGAVVLMGILNVLWDLPEVLVFFAQGFQCPVRGRGPIESCPLGIFSSLAERAGLVNNSHGCQIFKNSENIRKHFCNQKLIFPRLS